MWESNRMTGKRVVKSRKYCVGYSAENINKKNCNIYENSGLSTSVNKVVNNSVGKSDQQTLSIWENALGFIRSRIGNEAVETWFQPTKLWGLNGTKATVIVPNKFFGEWLSRNYLRIISEALQAVRPGYAGAWVINKC